MYESILCHHSFKHSGIRFRCILREYFNTSKILYNKTLIAKGEDKAGALVALECFGEGASGRCGCKQGYGNAMAYNTQYFNCVPCNVGKTSFAANQSACHDCASGRYADQEGQRDCSPCSTGTYFDGSGATSASQCGDCDSGKYAPTAGLLCMPCPPGTFCPDTGMSSYKICDLGRYSKFPLQTSCKSCPPGHYQNVTGQAFCRTCTLGTYSTVSGANSSALCQECPAGTYGDKKGMGTCTACPSSQYQPSTGESRCLKCTDIDEFKTNNMDHTGCIENEALYDSIVEIMFDDGRSGRHLRYRSGVRGDGIANDTCAKGTQKG